MDSGRSDAELVRQSLLGAKEPFAELVTRHRETAVALAARVLGSAELARDAAQEATIDALTSDSPGPAEIAEMADLAGRVRDAVATLPSGQRDAVLLFTCRA